MDAAEIVLIAGFIVAYGLVSGRLAGTPLTGPMLFVGFGLLAGDDGLGLISLRVDDAAVVLLAEVTLSLLLFSDAIRIDLRRLRHDAQLPARLLGIGLPLTIVAGAAAAYLVFDVDMWTAALIAAILAPTDAALGQVVVTSPRVPARIRQTLNVESGLNDGIAAPAVTIFMALAAAEEDREGVSFWIRFIAEQLGWGIGVGIAAGVIGGWLIAHASRRGWMEGTYRQLAVLGVAGIAVAGAEVLGGNSFIAAFVAGLSFGRVARSECPHVHDFAEDVGQLLAMMTFIVFGALLLGPSLASASVDVFLYGLLSLTIVRMVPVAVSLIGSSVRPPTTVFLSWFGPHGLASILFGLLVVEEGMLSQSEDVLVIVGWTVVLSVVLHGASAGWGARRYGAWYSDMSDEHDEMLEAVPLHEHRVRRPPRLEA